MPVDVEVARRYAELGVRLIVRPSSRADGAAIERLVGETSTSSGTSGTHERCASGHAGPRSRALPAERRVRMFRRGLDPAHRTRELRQALGGCHHGAAAAVAVTGGLRQRRILIATGRQRRLLAVTGRAGGSSTQLELIPSPARLATRSARAGTARGSPGRAW